MIEDASDVIDPPQEKAEVSPPPAVAAAYFTTSLVPQTTIDPHVVTSDLSPVLNL